MTRLTALVVVLAATLTAAAPAQEEVRPDSLGLPGDNLNLYAVLKIFRESPTIEEFEQKLNEENSRINNLDLNEDKRVDYIRVADRGEEDVRAFVLQVPVSDTESQDVAVILVDRQEGDRVRVQVVGDEALYGKGYIVEPRIEDDAEAGGGKTPNPAYAGGTEETALSMDGETVILNRTTTYEVAQWPIIRFIFRPGYVAWESPWYWGYYPPWWRSWRPWYWHYYWGYHHHWHYYYFGHYRRWHHYRHPWVHTHYPVKYRASSSVVMERRKSGAYRTTYSRPDLRREGRAFYEKAVPASSRPAVGRSAAEGRKPSARPGGERPAARSGKDIRSPDRKPSVQPREKRSPSGGEKGVGPGGRRPQPGSGKSVRPDNRKPGTRGGKDARPGVRKPAERPEKGKPPGGRRTSGGAGSGRQTERKPGGR